MELEYLQQYLLQIHEKTFQKIHFPTIQRLLFLYNALLITNLGYLLITPLIIPQIFQLLIQNDLNLRENSLIVLNTIVKSQIGQELLTLNENLWFDIINQRKNIIISEDLFDITTEQNQYELNELNEIQNLRSVAPTVLKSNHLNNEETNSHETEQPLMLL